MKIQWLGTAGFRLTSGSSSILIDPFLSRNPLACPEQPLSPGDLAPASHIFVSHGHFDHLMDVPAIARATKARVVCSGVAAQTLNRMGVLGDVMDVAEQDGQVWEAGPFRVQALESAHVRFDLKLVALTLARAGRHLSRILPLFRDWPCGPVFSWRIRAEGRVIQFFGSAGSGPEELKRLRAMGPVDLLLVPLQGHSHICGIALSVVRALSPVLVIPHHQDDFYPPLSQAVDIRPFLDGVARECPGTRIRTLEVNQALAL